jgi:peptidoglycan/xylan/chitin deacetylase (PgdA/CDA1 family)
LTIFSYHAVAPEPLPVDYSCFLPLDVFRSQVERIGRLYDVLPLEDALERLWSGRLRFPAAALTFDDGYRNNAEIAFPLLRRLGLPAALFVCTGPVAARRAFWFSRLHRALCLTRRRDVEWQGACFDLGSRLSRTAASRYCRAAFREWPPAEVEAACDALCTSLEVEDGSPDDPVFGVLDEAALRSLAAGGAICLGAHTRHHPILSRLPAHQQAAEIAGSADDLERWTGRRPRCFAYPYGTAEDFAPDSDAILGSLGFKAALTTLRSDCSPEHPWWRLPRIGMDAKSWQRRIR